MLRRLAAVTEVGCLVRRVPASTETEIARVLDVLRYAPSVQFPERWDKPPEPPSDAEPDQKQRRKAVATCRVSPAELTMAGRKE